MKKKTIYRELCDRIEKAGLSGDQVDFYNLYSLLPKRIRSRFLALNESAADALVHRLQRRYGHTMTKEKNGKYLVTLRDGSDWECHAPSAAMAIKRVRAGFGRQVGAYMKKIKRDKAERAI